MSRFGANVARERAVEIYQIELRIDAWLGDKSESIVHGSQKIFTLVDTKIVAEFETKEACDLRSAPREHRSGVIFQERNRYHCANSRAASITLFVMRSFSSWLLL